MDKKEVHPLGEGETEQFSADKELIPVDTFGGRVYVRWDDTAAVTPFGQVAFFIEFLKTGGVFDDWVNRCPLVYKSSNSPKKRDVLGTILLSVLAGHTRYAHIASIRFDNVNPGLLGMNKVVSEDATRRALKDNLDEEKGTEWLQKTLENTYAPLLCEPWILDVDTTVKLLYGKQEGAVVGYNPKKPGRPSHSYHAYMIANIRMILDVELHPGNESASKHSAPRLWSLLNNLPKSCWPEFIRGDNNFGTNNIMTKAEEIGVKYLFKLRQTNNVKKLINYCMLNNDWISAGQGWEGIESQIQLSGWEKTRRVILLRKQVPKEVTTVTKKQGSGQLEFQFAKIEGEMRVYEYAILVTSLSDEIRTISQHYRDRADSENSFDELKNQWGWCGYTTQDIKRSQIMARIIAIVYNWWMLFARLVKPGKHMEAQTSRPLLLNSVGKQTQHANGKMLTVTNAHAEAPKFYQQLKRLSRFFKKLLNTEQYSPDERWMHILSLAFVKYLRGRVLKPPNLGFIPA